MFNDEKGMATVDLLFATLIAVIIFGVFVASVNSSLDKVNMSDFGQMRMVGEKVVASIDKVYANGNGYCVDVTLTPVNDVPYVIIVNSNGTVCVSGAGNSVYLETVPKSNIQSITLNSGVNYTVTNNNGTIKIT